MNFQHKNSTKIFERADRTDIAFYRAIVNRIHMRFCIETSWGSRSKTGQASVEKSKADGLYCGYSSYRRDFIGLRYSDFAELG